MTEQTKTEVSHLSISDLLGKLKGLWEDMEEAQCRVEQIRHDIQKVEDELLQKLSKVN